MNRDSEFLHLFVTVLMMAPIFMFYAFIAMEIFNYKPMERLPTISPLVLAQVCTAFAKGTLP